MEETTTEQWLEHFRLVHRYREIKKDVELHKWYESEKRGYDIGWNRAYIDWLINISPSFYNRVERQDRSA